MIIKDIEISEIKIPLVVPFKTALRTVDAVDDILVRVTSDTGEVGYGEAPPTAVITGDIKPSIAGAIMNILRPTLIGRDVDDLIGNAAAMDLALHGNNSAKAAVDIALWDLYAKSCGKPLCRVLGGKAREVETDVTISVNPIEEMVADSLRGVSDGFNILKIKVGREGLKDVERIREIRRAVGPDIKLRVDANQGWEAKQSVRIIAAMEDEGLDIDLVEQPVKAHDLEGMRYVTSNTYTPILADESVFSATDAIEIIRTRAADLINIKLMKTGGITGALRICAVAEACGVECMTGCMLESKLSVSAAAHLAAARPIITRSDLDGPALCKLDPYEGGPTFDGARIIMNETPGIGITGVPFTPIKL
ncbi:MAG: dipeptide epimerase [Clostridia bacterium]|nr:dipeptide epimerase [Clostridia bacterium]